MEQNHPCRCQVADSLAYAAWRLKSMIEWQEKGSFRSIPDPAGNMVDYRSTPYYRKLSRILELPEVAFQDPGGVRCPYLVLLRALAEGWPGGECSAETGLQLVDVLQHIGAAETDSLAKIAQLALDRLQGQITGGLVPDWMEP